MALQSLTEKIRSGQDLAEPESQNAITQIMGGSLPAEEIKEFLLALREKGESLSEVVGAARAMRASALPIRVERVPVVDTCGTGGDRLNTVNISTMAALVVAGAGIAVAKHGNRSITSRCGSADLLEALGVAIDVEPAVVERCLRETGFGFLFAPHFHPAMKAVAPIRKALGVPTIFNLLGPLTNPAGVQRQVVGVANPQKLEFYAQALQALGGVRAMVVHGVDGQDEISVTGETQVVELNTQKDPKRLARYTITPEAFGIPKSSLEQLKGATPAENAQIAQEILNGKPGAIRNAVILNAAAALYVSSTAGDLDQGLALAADSLDKGKALRVLQEVRRMTHDQT